MSTTTATTSKTKKTATPFSAPIAEIHLVPLDLIDVHDQVRTTFDQESIEELAKDIEARGLMQPVLLNPDPNSGRFTMIAGERRLRAIKHNGQAAIPALLTKASADEVLLMQLAENVQREELSLEDECKAIVKLHEILGSLKEVSAKVKKSVPWCSKRFAMNQTNLHWRARTLLENGVTEDIDLIKAASSLFELDTVGWKEIEEWTRKIINGEAGRNEIRAALKAEKEKIKQEKTKEETKEKVSHAKVRTPPPPPAWTLDDALFNLTEHFYDGALEMNAIDVYLSYTEDQKKQIIDHLTQKAEEGAMDGAFAKIAQIQLKGKFDYDISDIEILAMLWGMKGSVMEIHGFFSHLQQPREKA